MNKANQNIILLSEAGLEYVEKIIENDKSLETVRDRVKRAVEFAPNKTTFKQAKNQVKKSKK